MTEANILQDPSKLPPPIFPNNPDIIGKKIIDMPKMFNRYYGKHDVLDGEYKLYQKVLAELLGTCIFVYGVCACGVFASHPLSSLLGGSFMGGITIYIFGR